MKIFITGGTSGIGEALAKLYLDQGHQVAVTGRNEQKFNDNFKDLADNKFLLFYPCDVKEKGAIHKAINDFAGPEKSLDLLIANAGISIGKKSKTPDFEKGIDVIRTNLEGTIYAFEGAYELMKEKKKGHLVAISSVSGFIGLPGSGPYCASKAAVQKFCETLSIDLKGEGINVTCINPGFVDTPLTRKNNHPMPFLMGAKRGARMIKRAIEKKAVIYTFPWQMCLIISILALLPRWLYRGIMRCVKYPQ